MSFIIKDEALIRYTGNEAEVVIPDGIEFIEENAFSDCTSLVSITFPDSIRYVAFRAFYHCTSLKEVHIADLASWCRIDFDYETSNPLYYAQNLYVNGELITDLTVPDGVKRLGNHTFCYYDKLTSVTLPDSVQGIAQCAFRFCKNLERFDFGQGIRFINELAFDGCTALKEINLPDSTTHLYRAAFAGCTSLEALRLSENLSVMDAAAFHCCRKLRSVVIPASVQNIVGNVFADCDALSSLSVAQENIIYHSMGNALIETASKTLRIGCQNTVIPDNGSVTKIASDAFKGYSTLKSIVIPDCITDVNLAYCKGLVDVTLPGTVKSIFFSECESLQTITIPDSVRTIDREAFKNCKNLKTVIFGENSQLKTIASYAFASCHALRSVVLPEGLLKIENYAFHECNALTSVTFPKSIQSIQNFAFSCPGLTAVHITDLDAWLSLPLTSASTPLNQAHRETVTLFLNGSPLSGDIVIPDFISNICDYAFYKQTQITSITIPATVSAIGSHAFEGCTALERVTIESDSILKNIEWRAFYGCGNLKEINLPQQGIKIADNAFEGCQSLSSKTVTLNEFCLYTVTENQNTSYLPYQEKDYHRILSEANDYQLEYELQQFYLPSSEPFQVDVMKREDIKPTEILVQNRHFCGCILPDLGILWVHNIPRGVAFTVFDSTSIAHGTRLETKEIVKLCRKA